MNVFLKHKKPSTVAQKGKKKAAPVQLVDFFKAAGPEEDIELPSTLSEAEDTEDTPTASIPPILAFEKQLNDVLNSCRMCERPLMRMQRGYKDNHSISSFY